MSEEVTNNGGNKRPTFLTVLCILSFIWIGLTVVSNLISIATFSAVDVEMMEDSMEELGSMMDEEAGGGFLDMIMSSAAGAMEHARTLAIISLIAQLLCLYGVLQMWKLKKPGFYMYVVGELAPPIASVVLVGGLAAGGFLFPIIFVILYGLNLKHLS